MRSKVRDWYK